MGKRVTVYYQPDDPSQSVLGPGGKGWLSNHIGGKLPALLGILAALPGLVGRAIWRRMRRGRPVLV
jgi:hypothetical protein